MVFASLQRKTHLLLSSLFLGLLSRGFLGGAVPRFMYENGFNNVLEVDQAGWSPLCYAALRGDPLVIEALLAKRADPNDCTSRLHHLLRLDDV